MDFAATQCILIQLTLFQMFVGCWDTETRRRGVSMGWIQNVAILMALWVVSPLAGAQDADYRIVNEGGLAPWWRLADGVSVSAPGYPETALSSRPDACVALGYVIERDGVVADPVVLRQWSSIPATSSQSWDDFGRSAVGELSKWRFAPANGVVARPTFTVATFFFSGGQSDPSAVREHCRIRDARDALVSARQAAYARGSINREWLDRAYRETLRREMRANQAIRCRLSQTTARDCVN